MRAGKKQSCKDEWRLRGGRSYSSLACHAIALATAGHLSLVTLLAADSSPDTIAKYLAGLTVPAAPADADVTPASEIPPQPAAKPSPARSITPALQNSNNASAARTPVPRSTVRPGSMIRIRKPATNATPAPSIPVPQPRNSSGPSDGGPSASGVQRFNARPASDPWSLHSAELDRAWKHTETAQLSAIGNWAPQNLGSAYTSSGTMFYMFSGPDFLYAHAFFPNARTYIFVGNEPVGPLPDIAKIQPNELWPALANIRKSLESVLSWSFFITKNMKTDLTQPQLSGTLPLLYVFLARQNCTIDSVTPVTVDAEGTMSETPNEVQTVATKGSTSGVKIVFRNPSTLNPHPSTLYYFCTDLSNDGIKATPGLMKFCESQGKGVSLLKAASYLMHEPGFSQVRQFLLDRSEVIVQDDSGIPFHFFTSTLNSQSSTSAGPWQIQLWGPYLAPIDVFRQYWQSDLADAFARTPGAPLPFGFGYQWQAAKSNLMVATRR